MPATQAVQAGAVVDITFGAQTASTALQAMALARANITSCGQDVVLLPQQLDSSGRSYLAKAIPTALLLQVRHVLAFNINGWQNSTAAAGASHVSLQHQWVAGQVLCCCLSSCTAAGATTWPRPSLQHGCCMCDQWRGRDMNHLVMLAVSLQQLLLGSREAVEASWAVLAGSL